MKHEQPRDDATSRRILTTAQVAEYLHVSLATLCRLARQGQIPAFRIGTDWRFDKDAIEKFMRDRNSEVLKKRGAAIRAAPKRLNRPSRFPVRLKRLIRLQDFGRRGLGIHCVGDRVFDVRAGLARGPVTFPRVPSGY